ncbi:hypothetical protein JNB71_21635 [Rhizobium herbae]|uniref:Transposase n=1 Tax=Rhizobium herbae TaxID=508661 RepID=A0ABS7HG80_9HYPH|nr:hypothetical protein [Rhizobium herbae]MBW9065914.1 hypothetical protein [Rhizobium herbae]
MQIVSSFGITPKSLRRILQITEGITAKIFHMIDTLAVNAIESGRECITEESVEATEAPTERETPEKRVQQHEVDIGCLNVLFLAPAYRSFGSWL